MSDRYPGRGAFMRCAPHGGHHDIFLRALPNGKRESESRRVHRSRHPVKYSAAACMRQPLRLGYATWAGTSSGFVGVLLVLPESRGRPDRVLTPTKTSSRPNGSRAISEPGPTVFAEWAIDGGIDGNTRQQKNAKGAGGKFTDGAQK